MSKQSEALDQALEDLAGALDLVENVTAVTAHCSSIPVSWVDYPGGRVGLDAAGSMVCVEFEHSVYGWVAE